jgi:riboflavin biosynthesis pyrimidine reductase
MAPQLLGSDARPACVLPIRQMREKISLRLCETGHIGNDLRLIYRPVY